MLSSEKQASEAAPPAEGEVVAPPVESEPQPVEAKQSNENLAQSNQPSVSHHFDCHSPVIHSSQLLRNVPFIQL